MLTLLFIFFFFIIFILGSFKKQKLHLDKWLFVQLEILLCCDVLWFVRYARPILLHSLANMLFMATRFSLPFTTHADFLLGFSIQFSIDSFSVFHIYKCLLINIESIEKITRVVEKKNNTTTLKINITHSVLLLILLYPPIITRGGLPLQSVVW